MAVRHSLVALVKRLHPSKNHRHLLGNGTAGSPFPPSSGLGFTGFFFPLRQPMLGMGRNGHLAPASPICGGRIGIEWACSAW